ncbi:MAG: ISAzo13-like element transposase-related protein [Pseudonocardiaceae bacterium]
MSGIVVWRWRPRRNCGAGVESARYSGPLARPGVRSSVAKSTRNLAAELTEMGHAVSHSVVAKILRSLKYGLQGTRKTLEGHQHPGRDAQFRYVNTLAGEFLASGDPVIQRRHKAGREVRPGR